MEAFTVDGLPEITEGDDLAGRIRDRTDLRPDDIVCVASTVVSKAEGRTADLAEFDPPSERAVSIADRLEAITGDAKDPRFAEAVLAASTELLIDAPFLLTALPFGHITVNAGIDRSNVPGADLLLLPENPTASARQLHSSLEVPVIVTDTSGRPFRYGQRGVAIGWAGLPASRDWRGERDRHGRRLEVTVQSIVDELAGTANLLAGEGDGGTPVVVIRGWDVGEFEASNELFRHEKDDFVRQALRGWTYQQ